jgi:hypothetical protein
VDATRNEEEREMMEGRGVEHDKIIALALSVFKNNN